MAGYSVTFSVVDNATKNIDAINKRMAALRAPLERLSHQVTRFVDVSGLRKVAQGFEWIGRTAAGVLRTLTQIVPVLGTITGAATLAGMIKLVNSYAAWSHELVGAAANIGTTTQKLQQFEDATRLAGGNAADMRAGLKGLHDSLADFNIGAGGAALTGQWANKLGINLRDANGNIRDTTELMPELIQKLADVKNPADRAAASAALLGAGGEKLVQSFRQSSKPFAQWFADVQRYKDLTDEQKQSLQLFTEAQGRLGVGFDRLGQQISAMTARHFSPLLTRLSAFVEKHTPDILRVLDRLEARFAAWLESFTWDDVEAGINRFIDALKWVCRNIDTLTVAAEALAAVFVLKWGGEAVLAVRALTAAIGVGGVAGGSLLASLAAVAAIASTLVLKGDTPGAGEPATPEQRARGEKRAAELNKGQGYSGDFFSDLGKWMREGLASAWDHVLRGPEEPRPGMGLPFQRQSAGGGYLPGGVTPAAYHPGGVTGQPGIVRAAFHPGAGPPTAPAGGAGPPPGPMNLPAGTVQRGAAITDQLATALGLTREQAAGITGNLQAESGLQAVQERNPISGRGGFGWAQWTGPRRVAFEAYAKEHGLDPRSDEANYGFLKKELQSPEYAGLIKQLGGLKGPNAARDAAALFERLFERPAVSNAGVRGGHAEAFAKAPRAPPGAATPVPGVDYPALTREQLAPPVAAAPRVTMPPAQAPVNGAVDVSITHKNPPPNSAVTATGSGAVNVAPVRVERQEMSDI